MGNSQKSKEESDLDEDSSPLIGAVIKEGYLLKRARRSGRNWRRRWVQLVQVDMHSGALVYFDSKPKNVTVRPNGRVEINKNTTCVATRQFEKNKKPHCLMISRPDTDYTFYASASTKTDLHYWVKSVEDLVDKFSKVAFNRQSRKIYTMQGTLRSKVTKRLRQSMIQSSDGAPIYDTLEYLNTAKENTTTFNDEMKREDKLRRMLLDLWNSEETYHNTLKVLSETFVPVMQKHKVDPHNVMVFTHIEQVKELHAFLIAELRSCVQNIQEENSDNGSSEGTYLYNTVSHVADIFSRYAPFFLIYVSVVKKLPASSAAVRRKMKQDRDFRVAMEVAQMDPRCEDLDFHSLAIKLVQRVPHYNLILRDFLKHVPDDAADAHENLVLAQAKLTEVIAKLDHNAQSGWKVRNHQSVVLASHRLLSHGHPEAMRRQSQFWATKDEDEMSADDEDFDFDDDEEEDSDAPLSVLRTTVLPETLTLSLKSKNNSPITLSSAPVSSRREEEEEEEEKEEEESFVPFGLRPKRGGRKARPRSVRLEKKKTVLENKTSPVSGLRKRGKLNLNVNVRTFVPSKALSPSERGRNLLTQALSSPQRKRASLRINQTLRRHVSHVDKSEEILEKSQRNRGTGLVHNLLGLTHNTDPTKQRPLALGRRRPVKAKQGDDRPISLCVYMPVTFSLVREFTWLLQLGRLDRYNAPPPPIVRQNVRERPLQAECLNLYSAESPEDSSMITVEEWKNVESGEHFRVQEGPGDNLMVELASGDKLVITMESTIEVMANGYSRQRNSDSSEVYSTPWGVRKIYLSNGCIVTTYPDGTKTQQNPDGSEIRKLKDGTVLQVSSAGVTTIRHPDGTKIQRNPRDNSTVEMTPDGTIIQTEADNTIIVKLKDGTVVEHHPDGTKITVAADGRCVQENPDGTRSKFFLPPRSDLETEDERLQDLSYYPETYQVQFKTQKLGIKFGRVKGFVAYVFNEAKRLGVRPGDRFWRVNGLDVVDPAKFECAGPADLDIDHRFIWAVKNTTSRPIFIDFRRRPKTDSSDDDDDDDSFGVEVTHKGDTGRKMMHGRPSAPRARNHRAHSPSWRNSYAPKNYKKDLKRRLEIRENKKRELLSSFRKRSNRVSMPRKKISSSDTLLVGSVAL